MKIFIKKEEYKFISKLSNKLLFTILLSLIIIINVSLRYNNENGLDRFIFGKNQNKVLKYNTKEKLQINEKINNSIYHYFHVENKFLSNGRITAFINADNIYLSYIPIYCASLLYCDKRNRTDIEIIVNTNKLPNKIMQSIKYLKSIYKGSKILIRYNMYRVKNKYAYINDKKMLPNSIRYFIEPKIKNEYVFIGDIDIIYLFDNYYDNYLLDMFNRTSCYSNIVRPNSRRLTGVHFSKWFCLYPIIISKKFNFMKNDEELLYIRLKELGIEIDHSTTFRPILGIHMSVNRPTVENKKTKIHWEAKGKKKLWEKFKESDVYKSIS